MSKPMILAIDQGTTSSRAIVFDAQGRPVARAQEEFAQIFPQSGWVEHDPEAIWNTTLRTAQAALREAEASGGRVLAIGVTNQRETTLVWDRATLRPIANAIVWQDRRTSEACAALRAAGHEELVTARTGLVLDPYFSASKIGWILDRAENARAAAARGALAFGTVDSFLLARLTGGAHLTDATNASRTALFDIRRNDWDDDLLSLFDVPRAMLPEVRDSNAHFGETLAEHFGRPIPVLGVMGDQQAAAFGQACFAPGQVKATYGTGAFIVAQTGAEAPVSNNRLLTTIARRIDGQNAYALEGSIFVAGAAVQWLRDALGVIATAPETEALARSLSGNDGVYFVPAFTGLGAPHWDAEARGAIVGLSRGTGKAHLARAALEAACYQTADLLDAMRRDGAPVDVLRVDGGMTDNGWMLQFLADMLNLTVDRPALLETTAQGTAFLAGMGAGLFGGMDDIAALREVAHECGPDMAASERNVLMNGWRDALAKVKST